MMHRNEGGRVFPWNLIMRGIQMGLTLLVGAGILWIDNRIEGKLADYVTKVQLSAHHEAHIKWVEEVVRRLEAGNAENNRRLTSIEAKLDRLSERRSAAITNP
jgi:hypothetical protein